MSSIASFQNNFHTKYPFEAVVTVSDPPHDSSNENSIIENVIDRVIDLVRIDHSIKEMFENPSLKNLGYLSLHALQLTLVGTSLIFLSPIEVIVQIAFSILILNLATPKNWHFSFSESFPLNKAVQHIVLGTLSFLVVGHALVFTQMAILHIMEACGLSNLPSQDIEQIINMDGGVGLFWGLYACIGAPIIEEIIFRGIIQNSFSKSAAKEKASEQKFWTKEKFKTILKTAFVFGILHATLNQGWSNIPIVTLCFMIGIFCSLLKEATGGSLWAPIALHATNNTLSILHMWKKI